MGPFDVLDHPVFALTTKSGAREDAMIATWIYDVSLVPDKGRVIVALTPDHLSTELILESRRFTVNVLAEGQHEYLPRFGLASGHDKNKLAGLELARTRSGLPILPGTCGYAECEVIDTLKAIDRVIFAAAVREHQRDKNKKSLTVTAAYQALPKEIGEQCEAQRSKDGERLDRKL